MSNENKTPHLIDNESVIELKNSLKRLHSAVLRNQDEEYNIAYARLNTLISSLPLQQVEQGARPRIKAGATEMRSRMLSIANEKAKEEAIGFAEWILDKGYRPVGLHLWSITPELDTTDPKNIMVKSSELFDLYLSTKTPTTKP